MLRITIPARPKSEYWDSEREVFIEKPATKEVTLQLEHSLVSLSKWEAKWCKPFLTKEKKTVEESIDYIRCMTITQNVDPEVYNNITDDLIEQVSAYIDAPMTASYVSEEPGGASSRETITSELIYYWMIALQIPPDYQKWHLNRLMMLIKICNRKNAPHKPMGQNALMRRNAALNAARRKKHGSKG